PLPAHLPLFRRQLLELCVRQAVRVTIVHPYRHTIDAVKEFAHVRLAVTSPNRLVMKHMTLDDVHARARDEKPLALTCERSRATAIAPIHWHSELAHRIPD